MAARWCCGAYLSRHGEQFAENARDVAAIDLVDNQVVPTGWISLRVFAQLLEDSVAPLKGELVIHRDRAGSLPENLCSRRPGETSTYAPAHRLVAACR